jgi:hypothetical protein
MDKGPWTVGPNNDRIDSDDFTRDASLILYGDFAPEEPENKRAYLQFIADELNSCAALRARIEVLEKLRTCVKCKMGLGYHDVDEFYKD